MISRYTRLTIISFSRSISPSFPFLSPSHKHFSTLNTQYTLSCFKHQQLQYSTQPPPTESSGLVFLIDEKGNIANTPIPLEEAKSIAKNKRLMLKQVGKKENHVLCKMFPFPQKTAPTTTAKATAKTVEKAPLEIKKLKEVHFSGEIADHDRDVKIRKAEQFLEKGYHVQIYLKTKTGEVYNEVESAAALKRLLALFDETLFEVATKSSGSSGSKMFGCIIKPKVVAPPTGSAKTG